MLRQIPPTPPLDAAERYALSILLDLSRLLLTQSAGDVVELRVEGGSAGAPLTLAELRQAEWGLRMADGSVEIRRDVLRLVTSAAGAVAEQGSSATDRHGRVPHTENDLVRASLEREPVVHRVAQALRQATIAAAGRRRVVLVAPWPDGRRWAVAMSHDLDVVSRWPVFTVLRIGELLTKREVGAASRAAAAALTSLLRDPVLAAARDVLATERRLGIRSTWFVITGTPTLDTMRAGDITYLPESPACRRILDAVGNDEHEIGLHGSFATVEAPRLFLEQRERLTLLGQHPVHGVRQHFIRMRPGLTHREMAVAGFQYDSTFGFSDRNGFRLGVADVVPVWDQAAGRALAIDELPFVWMDRALSKYQGVEDPQAWIDDALELAKTCQDAEGVWCGIWHPNLAPALGYPGAPAAFARLCEGLLAGAPWAATMGEIVRWRRARRQIRLAPDSSPETIRVNVPAGAPGLALEDAAGNPVPFSRV